MLGHVGDKDVVLVRSGNELFAVGANCTHYRGPLAEGLVVGDTIRCPWHHACFSLRTGEAVRAPALDPMPAGAWTATAIAFCPGEDRSARGPAIEKSARPSSIVIVGGGAAGVAAAEMIRREGYDGPLTMIGRRGSAGRSSQLSKDYLAGKAQDDWIPLCRPSSMPEAIQMLLGRRVASIDQRGESCGSTMARSFVSERCSWPPARIRCGCRFQAPMAAR